MPERRKIINGLAALGLAISQTACQAFVPTEQTPAKTCPPGESLEGPSFSQWRRLEVGGEPYVFPLTPGGFLDDQARFTIVEVWPGEAVWVRLQMPGGISMEGIIENDPGAMRFSDEVDWGVQFWACEDESFGFIRLVPLRPVEHFPEA